jgi:hypothetical protein
MRNLDSKPIKIAKAFSNDRPNCSYSKSLLIPCSRHLGYVTQTTANVYSVSISLPTNVISKKQTVI